MENQNTYSIYKFTFSDGKVYIGQTSLPVEERWRKGEGYCGQEVYVPITLDGWNNVKKEILHTGLSSEQADKLEKYYIKKFNSCIDGYNRTSGGKHTKNIKKETELLALRKQLEQPILLKLPQLLDMTSPNKLLSLEEIFAKSDSTEELVYEDLCGACISTYQSAADCRDVFAGGEGQYTFHYLVSWRCWAGNPDIRTMINTPWLQLEDVVSYNLTFLRDSKAKKYTEKYHTFPSINDNGFKNYDYKTNSYT